MESKTLTDQFCVAFANTLSFAGLLLSHCRHNREHHHSEFEGNLPHSQNGTPRLLA